MLTNLNTCYQMVFNDNKTKSKVFSLERLYKFCIKNIFQKNFRSEKNFVSEKKFSLKILVPKNCGLKKSFCLKKIWVKNFCGTKIIFGLRILGQKKFRFWKKIGDQKNFGKKLGSKKFWKKELKAKIDFGSEKIFGKKLWVQKNFDPKKKF